MSKALRQAIATVGIFATLIMYFGIGALIVSLFTLIVARLE